MCIIFGWLRLVTLTPISGIAVNMIKTKKTIISKNKETIISLARTVTVKWAWLEVHSFLVLMTLEEQEIPWPDQNVDCNDLFLPHTREKDQQ